MATRLFIFNRAAANTYEMHERVPSGEKPIFGTLFVRKTEFKDIPEAMELSFVPVKLEQKRR